MVFSVLLLIPLIITLGGFLLGKSITWKEFLCQVGVQIIVAGASAGIISCANTSDTEVWNGTVVNKNREWTSCSHSYPCNPHPCNCDKHGCSTCFDTCYEHSNDWNWTVYTSNNESVNIDRIDRQGVWEPPRFTQVQIGEPTAFTHTYTNYIKAAPGSLFRYQGLIAKYKGRLPEYPQTIRDYFHIDRLVLQGVSVSDVASWNSMLAKVNGDLGKANQSNIIVVLVKDMPDDYFYALEEYWLGGKKNDVVLVVDVDSDLKPVWASVMAWSSNGLFQVKLRDDIMGLPKLDPNAVDGILRRDVPAYYSRKPMADFKYLESSITPSTTEWVVSLIIGVLIAVGLSWFFWAQDPFGDDERRRYGYH